MNTLDLRRHILRQQAFRDTVQRSHPMGAARIVRRERFAWPGAYPLALILSDGEVLCPACVASEWAQISNANRHQLRDGWRPVGIEICEAPETDVICAHCGHVIAEGTETSAPETITQRRYL